MMSGLSNPPQLGLVLALLLASFAVQTASAHESESVQTPGLQLVSLRPAIGPEQLEKIVDRLKQTPAIGTLKKLALQYRLDELRHEIASYDGGEAAGDPSLRRKFNGLVNELLVQLRERDQPLYRDVARARRALWRAVVNDRWDR